MLSSIDQMAAASPTDVKTAAESTQKVPVCWIRTTLLKRGNLRMCVITIGANRIDRRTSRVMAGDEVGGGSFGMAEASRITP